MVDPFQEKKTSLETGWSNSREKETSFETGWSISREQAFSDQKCNLT